MFDEMPRATKRKVRRLLKGVLAAADELMTEFVSKKRAANWSVINSGLNAAGQAVRGLADRARKGPKRARSGR